MLERSQSLLQYYNNLESLQDWFSTDQGSHTPRQDEGDKPMMYPVTGLQTRYEHRPDVITGKQEQRNRQLSTLIVNIETDVQAE